MDKPEMMEFTEEKKDVVCPSCGSKDVELILTHYYIKIAVFLCNNCKGQFEKYFEIKEEKDA